MPAVELDAHEVIGRLEEAGATLVLLPTAGRSPAMRTTRLDMIRAALDGGLTTQSAPVPALRPGTPEAARISRMDEALGWVTLIPLDKYVLRRIVGARALVSPLTGKHLYSWRRLGTLLGADHKAIKRWHAQGIALIVAGLARKVAA